jgi:hypothetical protein
MRSISRILFPPAFLLALAMSGCSHQGKGGGEHGSGREAARGEHDRDEGGEGEGEESGSELGLDETYDKVRRGARLVLAYEQGKNAFVGTVENTTKKNLRRVRVEVHLSNGKELVPTKPSDLAPGEKGEVELAAETGHVERWNAHPEVGSGEHGGEGEGREHDGKRKGEHARREGESAGNPLPTHTT